MAGKWMAFGVAEGGTKAASRTISKTIGFSSGSILGVVLANGIGGLIQMLGGWAIAKQQKTSVKVTRGQLTGAVMFGLVATAMGIIGTYAFTYEGADVAVTTFIVISSIIPGALVDHIFFGHRLNLRQWLGIGVFLLAGWAILDFPGSKDLVNLPAWVLWTMLLPFLAVVNEAITQWQGQNKVKLGTMANNFWIGLTSVIASAIIMLFLLSQLGEIADYPGEYWIGSFARGGLVVAMIAFKLKAYQMGGTIAIKKVVMQTSYLALATLMGIVFFQEALTTGKITAIPLFIVAFSMIDNDTWEALKRKIIS